MWQKLQKDLRSFTIYQRATKSNSENVVEVIENSNQHATILAHLSVLIITGDKKWKEELELDCNIDGVGKITICLQVSTVHRNDSFTSQNTQQFDVVISDIILDVLTLSAKGFQKSFLNPKDYKVAFIIQSKENLVEKILSMYPNIYKQAFALGAQTLFLEKLYPLLPLFVSTVQTDFTYLQELKKEKKGKKEMFPPSQCEQSTLLLEELHLPFFVSTVQTDSTQELKKEKKKKKEMIPPRSKCEQMSSEFKKRSYKQQVTSTTKPTKYELLDYLSMTEATREEKPIALKTREFDEQIVIDNFIGPALELYRPVDQPKIYQQLYRNAGFFLQTHTSVIDIDHILNQTQLTQKQKDERITFYLKKCLQTPEKRKKVDPNLKIECIGIAANTVPTADDKIGYIRNLFESNTSQLSISNIVQMKEDSSTIYVYFEGLGFDNPQISLWNTCHWLHKEGGITAKPMGVHVDKYESIFVGSVPAEGTAASVFSGASNLNLERGEGICIAHLDSLYTNCELVREHVSIGGFNALTKSNIFEKSQLWQGNEDYTSLKTLEHHATKTASVILDVAPHAKVIGYPCVSGMFAPVLFNPYGDFQRFCENLIHAGNNDDVDVISVSLAVSWPFLGEGWGIKGIVDEIRRKNKIMIAASGNFPKAFGRCRPLYPANFSAVVAAMGCKPDKTAWEHSPYRGDGIGLAEGVKVTSIRIDEGPNAEGYYQNVDGVGNGTSYATAALAGIAAIFLQHKDKQLEDIREEYNAQGVYFVDIFKYLLHSYAQLHKSEDYPNPIRYYKYPIDDITKFLDLQLPSIAEVKRFIEIENADEHINTIRNKLNIPMDVGTDGIWDELRWLDITYSPNDDQLFRMLVEEYHQRASNVVKAFLQPYRLQTDDTGFYTYQLAPFNGFLDKFVGFYQDRNGNGPYHIFFNKEPVINTRSGKLYCHVWPLVERGPYSPPNFFKPDNVMSIYGPWSNFPGIVYTTHNRTRLDCLIFNSGSGPTLTSVPFSHYVLSNDMDRHLNNSPFTIVRLASYYCTIHNVLHLCVVVAPCEDPAETRSIFTISICGTQKQDPAAHIVDLHAQEWTFSFRETNGVVYLLHNARENRLICQ